MMVWGNNVISGYINQSKWQAVIPDQEAVLIDELISLV
jgi:hypothetical protein